jgi:hypothetical protein
MVRVLAASKPGGLLLDVEAPELSFFLATGMAITSQLVVVNIDPVVHAVLKELLADDIRISVHAQQAAEFLRDVSDHRFDLVVFGDSEPPAARLAASSLARGGLLAAFHLMPGGDDGGGELQRTLTDCGLLIAPGSKRWLIAARPADEPEAKRRGGRRGRPPSRG